MLVSVAGTLLFAACATRYLVPARDAERLYPESTAVVEERAGVQVIADARAWRGSLDVLDEYVPVWLSITNRTGRSLYVSPVDVELVGEKLRARAELPLAFDPQPLQTTESEAFQAPDVQPPRTAVGLAPTTSNDRVGVFSDQIEVRSEESRLRDEIRRRGFRNGELESEENASGFVYFERASWSTGRVALRVTLRSRGGGARVTTVTLPFSVI